MRRDLDEMNDLVGEISHLVWQNEPLPPPPDLNEDLLTPYSRESIPDFEKTPTNELASPCLAHGYDNVDLCPTGMSLSSATSTCDSADGDSIPSLLCYENIMPEGPPPPPPRDTVGHPALPPRPAPNIPARISREDAEKWNLTPSLPPRETPLILPPPRIAIGYPAQTLKPNNTVNIPARGPPSHVPPRVPERGEQDTPPQIIVPSRVVVPPRVPLPPRPASNPRTLPPRNHTPTKHSAVPVYTTVECKTSRNNGSNWGTAKKPHSLPHDWSPYVMPVPASEIWNENNENIEQKMSKTFKKKVKMKNAGRPQR